MLQSDAWLMQAKSDYSAAKILYEQDQEDLYCHVVAKIQQCIEKAIKGLAVLILRAPIGRGHDVSRFLAAFRRLPNNHRDRSIQSFINSTFNQHVRELIQKLDQVFPKWPAPGQSFQRNTEYPFESNGAWTCPCDIGIFTSHEVDELREAAHKIIDAATRLRTLKNRQPRTRN